MSGRLILLLLVALGLVIAFLLSALPAFGQSGIQVSNADATRAASTSLTQDLNAVLGGSTSRIVTQYSNALLHAGLSAPSGALQSLLAQAELRIVLQFAEAARQSTTVFPRALVGDTTVPVLSAMATVPDAGGMRVTWVTDEFADSAVIYGMQSGNYPEKQKDPLYRKNHGVLLTGLEPGIYFYRAESRDQSGNVALSSEGSFSLGVDPVSRTYLPLLWR